MALAFTSVIRLIQQIKPDAFARIPAHQREMAAASDMLYFSFMTPTSTGYEEIRRSIHLRAAWSIWNPFSGNCIWPYCWLVR
jgi:hypothetical protein